MDPDILHLFVSHSHTDNDFSLRLVTDLRWRLGERAKVWHDISGSLFGGDDWWNEIVTALDVCDVFLLVVSFDAMSSNVVTEELQMAQYRKLQGKTRIIPVLHMPCTMRLDLSTLQYVSFLPPRDYRHCLDDLVSAIQTPSSQPRQYLQTPENVPPLHTQLSQAIQRPILPLVIPTLLVLSITGAFGPRHIAIPSNTLAIGRDVQNQLAIDDPSVSRRHIQIARVHSRWFIERMSEAGTCYLDGVPITERTRLHSGSQIVIGGTILRFELPEIPDGEDAQQADVTLFTASPAPQLTVDCVECHFVVPLRGTDSTIGRGPDNSIVIPSPIVSQHHAVIRQDAASYTITDQHSLHGLLLGGRKLTGDHRLISGDLLTISDPSSGHSVTLIYSDLT